MTFHEALDLFRQSLALSEAVSGRLFGKGGNMPGPKTVQRLRGSQSAHARSRSPFGAEAGRLTGEWDRMDVDRARIGRLSKRRRAAGRQEIEVQKDD